MKKPILLLAIGFFITSFSCSKNSCDGEKASPPYFDIKGLKSAISRVTRNSPTPLDNDTVALKNLALDISVEADYYFAVKKPSFFFGTAAFACDPAPSGYLGTKEQLEELTITSDFDFDSTHPKGTNLTDLFQIRYGQPNQLLSEMLSKKPLQAPQYLNLLLKQKPSNETQKFKVYMKLSNGEQYTTENITVRIK